MRRQLLSALLGVLAIVGAWQLCYVPYRCNVEKKNLVARSQQAATSRDAERAMRMARSIILRARELVRMCPNDVDMLMILAANQRVVGAFAEAAQSYREALGIQKRQELYYELGATELSLGNRAAAIDAFENCVRFYPSQIANIDDQEIRAAVVARVFSAR